MSLDVCPKEQLFSVFGDGLEEKMKGGFERERELIFFSSDRYIRIFSFATGKLVRKINENLDIYNKAQVRNHAKESNRRH